MHLQDAALFLSWQSALMPQGEGLQGWITSMGRGAERGKSSIFLFLIILTCDASTLREGISLVSLITDANWNMVPNPTCCMDATQPRARVKTFLVFASQRCWTVIVKDALRMAVWGTANHIWLAGAVTAIPLSSWGIRIWSTWVGVAGVLLYNWLNS